MEITKKLYVTNRQAWRAWLAKNGAKQKEIWLVYYNKASGKPRSPYNDAVEEALCYGWIDSIVKKIDGERFAQRFTPRRKGSRLSQMNKERVKILVKKHRMTKAGLAAAGNVHEDNFSIPPAILKALKADKLAWKHFQAFPPHYQRIRVAYIHDTKRVRPVEYKKRLAHFLKKTRQNKRFGMIR